MDSINLVLKKNDCKQNFILLNSSNGSKIVLILLTKVITLYIEPIAIDIRGFSLKFIPKLSFF